jgi:Galactosyltransferase
VFAFEYFVCRCPQTTYVAKTDDDVYVNVAALVQRLNDEEKRFRSAFGAAASRSFIAGRLIDSAKPVRDRRSKWYTPETMFDGQFYPPYTSGTGYAMGLDVARRLLEQVLEIRKMPCYFFVVTSLFVHKGSVDKIVSRRSDAKLQRKWNAANVQNHRIENSQ